MTNDKIELIDTDYCSKYCLLPLENGEKLEVASSKIVIMDRINHKKQSQKKVQIKENLSLKQNGILNQLLL